MDQNPEPSKAKSRIDPESLLGARLRTVRPELDRRFEEMRRDLARTPRRPAWLEWLAARSPAQLGWAAAAAIVVAAGTVVFRPATQSGGAPDFDPAEYGELLSLNDALAPALPLADRDLRSAVIEMPVSPKS
ncbi:hypothetical protein DB347_11965 [Opitutaceae bacterium EW11]|nr:hypothetical protein DB347_11965 [Opitutaceae bacterium EW11]